MNIEIANRLIELRMKSGLSQEELADRLGLSRQAVSKWERAEASPDTDNLICLARIYGVSLDDLLNTDESIEDIARNVKEERASLRGPAGVRLTDDEGQAIECDDEGITIVDKDGERLTIDEARKKYKKYDGHKSKGWQVAITVTTSVLMLLAIITYLLLGFYVPYYGWSACWIVILIPIIIASILEAIEKRNPNKFAFPVLIVCVYIALGMFFELWHPLWILFLLIPVYYAAMSPFNKKDKDCCRKEKYKSSEDEERYASRKRRP